jgi:outer membrane protein OmpA-like peptidoglycan-associated protein
MLEVKLGSTQNRVLALAIAGIMLSWPAGAGAQGRDVGVEVMAPPAKSWDRDKSSARLGSAACAEALAERGGRVTFESGQAVLTTRQQGELEGLGRLLSRCEGVRVVVSGFADAEGGARWNQRLSEQRAAMVADLLVKAGVAEPGLRIAAYGETRPLRASARQARDRRVEITVEAK